jgi:hypothetical protein
MWFKPYFYMVSSMLVFHSLLFGRMTSFVSSMSRKIKHWEELRSSLVSGGQNGALAGPDAGWQPAPPPCHGPSLVLLAAWTKCREACEHVCASLAKDTRLLLLLVFIVVVLPHGGIKSLISRSISSVVLFVICQSVLLLVTRCNWTFICSCSLWDAFFCKAPI